MKVRNLAVALAATFLIALNAASAQYGPPPQGPPQGYQQGPPQGYGPPRGDWDSAPPEFREWQQRGFHDGVEGAKKDFENHRAPDVRNRDEFRHPHVPGPFRHDYKDGFRRGYDVAVHHMEGGPR